MAKMYLGEIPISKIYGSGNSQVVNDKTPKYINKRGTLYRLIFEDDFEGNDIDRNVWSSDYRSAHYDPWYVCGSDYFVDDSVLNLRVRTDKRTLDSASWKAAVSGVQSAQVSSPNAKHDFRPFYGFVSQEGYYELRCKMYSGLSATLDGSHFAWWTTGVDTDNGKDCEYDMIEHFGLNPKLACLNIHPNSDTDITFKRGTYTADYDLGVGWHTWGFLWEEDHLEVFLDDVQIISLDATTPKYPVMQWLTAYRSLGEREGYWAGEYDPNQPDMISQIDYLRVYKKADEIKTEPVTVVSYDPISVELTKGEYTINQTSGRLTAVPLHCYVHWNDGSRTEHIVHYETFTHDQISILDNGGTFEMRGIAMGCGVPIKATIIVKSYDESDLGNELYSFGAIADIHVPYGDGEQSLKKTISVLENEGAEFICTAGDVGVNGTVSELQTYKNVVDEFPTIKVYSCNGNHDRPLTNEEWKTYAGHDLNYVFEKENDVFIIFSLITKNEMIANENTPYGAENLAWLQEQFDLYKGRRIFVFTHYPLSGYSGLLSGQYYGFSGASTEDDTIISAMNETKNVIYFSGHTHYRFEVGEEYDKVNVNETSFGATVHIPSSNYPTNSSSVSDDSASQGYLVTVYENAVVLKAMDFVTGNYIYEYTHVLPIKNQINE